ncbi:MAG: CHAT domain-containing tetratricopeptide repeat protein [Bacteroidota bacterium]
MRLNKKNILTVVFWFFVIGSSFSIGFSDARKMYEEARSYWNKDWEKCASILEQAISEAKEDLGEDDDFYGVLLNDLGISYWHLGQLDKAEELFQQVITIKEDNFGEGSIQYGASLVNLAGIYNSLGDFQEADIYYSNGIEAFRNADETETDQFIGTLNNYGIFLQEAGLYFQAEQAYFEALDVTETIHDSNHPILANTYSNLGKLYTTTGNYADSENYLNQALELYRDNAMNESHEYIVGVSNLASLYEITGNFGKAEKTYLDILEMRSGNKLSQDYAQVIGNLATLYRKIGNRTKALEYLESSRDTYQESVGKYHPDYAIATNNLAEFYKSQGDLDKAEEFYKEALELFKLVYSKIHPYYATALNNLASLNRSKGNYDDALKLYEETLLIDEITVGTKHAVYATTLSNMGLLYFSMGEFEKAEPYLKQSLEIRKETLGEKHPSYSKSLSNLGLFYLSQENLQMAEPLFIEAIETQLSQVEVLFPSLSEKEKEDYYNTIKQDVERFNSIAILRSKESPSILGEMYNAQLATKAILFNASDKMRRSILGSNDKELIDSFNKWRNLHRDIAAYYQFSKEELESQNIDIDRLLQMANSLEKTLSVKSSVFADNQVSLKIDWKNIKNSLKKGEAAIELVRFREFKSVKDSDSNSEISFGFTPTVFYAALIITPETIKAPKLVLLEDGSDMEGRDLAYFKNAFRFRVEDWNSYNKYWRPIANELEGIDKVYFSPSGVYHTIILDALFNREAERFLIDELDVHRLTSTRDLVEKTGNYTASSKAILIGNPDFMIEPKERGQIVSKNFPESNNFKEHTYNHLLEIEYGAGYLRELPGSEEEIEKIANVMALRSIESSKYIGSNALEEVVKSVNNPKVLHIATHGFFLESKLSTGYLQGVSQENPLFKSGLFLGGAGNSLYRNQNNLPQARGIEDGILTAYEAMNLNLEGTDLVVLSACETGLGRLEHGEGIYGLERSFKVAGAKALLISLFEVEDYATQELMVSFYESWALDGNIRAAFKKAQLDYRKKHPEPYFWAPFIMIGG